MKKHFLNVCAALFALVTLTALLSVSTRADSGGVYAILYDDGTFVFQYGDTPESDKSVTKTYAVDLDTVYAKDNTIYNYRIPWYNERESVRVVNFKDKISPTVTAAWFYECKNLKRVENIQNLDTSNLMSICSMFNHCLGLTALDVSGFHTAKVTDMYGAFRDCRELMELDVSGFDTAKVTNMADMFSNCGWLTELDVSGFDTSKVTDTGGMFFNCSGLTTLDVSGFNTANVTDMGWMFSGCSKLTKLDISGFNTANVQYMTYMFYNCSGLTALDVSGFDTAKVTSMYGMFSDCSGLTALDLSGFDTAKVTDIYDMFSGCSNLKTIYASGKFTTASATDSSDMFKNCASLVGGNGTKYDGERIDGTYARIDAASAPGYFTAYGSTPTPEPEPTPTPETYVITAYAGEGGSVTPAGDTRVSVGGEQRYVITPNDGYRVQSVRVDGVEVGALSEYVFQNVSAGHNIAAMFERLPSYAIIDAVANGGELSVTLENADAVTVAAYYFDSNGKFLAADMQSVPANAETVTFPLPFAYKARVAMFDSDCRPMCAPVTVR